MLVYSCLHYLLLKNEKKNVLFLRSNVSPISMIKQDHESGVDTTPDSRSCDLVFAERKFPIRT